MTNDEAHRPSALKQTNKPHKTGRHRSKGSISSANKGKQNVKLITKGNRRELNRIERRNKEKQRRKNQVAEVLAKKRGIGGLSNCAPFLVTVIPLNDHTNVEQAIKFLKQSDANATIRQSGTGNLHLCSTVNKQRFSFIIPPKDNIFATLDALKVSDFVLYLASVSQEVNENFLSVTGENILITSNAQGSPTPIVAITDLRQFPQTKHQQYKQQVQKVLERWFPKFKLHNLDNMTDGKLVMQSIGNSKKNPIHYRDERPYLLAEEVEFIDGQAGAAGLLKITGFLRGSTLDVNGLIHIPNLGEFQIEQIDGPPDPYSRERKNRNPIDAPPILLKVSDITKQETLDAENIPDPETMEEAWPPKDMLEDDLKPTKIVKRVPAGISETQAAWYSDDEISDDNAEEYNDELMHTHSEQESEADDDGDHNFEDANESEIDINDDRYDEQVDYYEERKELEKIQAAKTDHMFPDEVDTPLNVPARERFKNYRGLESFRDSPWDAFENLPEDYSKIFRFDNFKRAYKRILKEREVMEDGIEPGSYITIHVKDVYKSNWENIQALKTPLIIFGLFRFEHRMSVMNVVLKRTNNYKGAIKSKERLIFQCGFRRFQANPVFSEHTNGTKYKLERYFQEGRTVVASYFGRVQYPPAPILCYKEINNQLILVATGSLFSCNPDRIILKRVTLTGHPFKIHKNSCVIRFLFFNREDINYFKKINLKTKCGKVGHIKEALGTHGHIKCIFTGQLKGHDTVMMYLYKRIFPKWTYEDYLPVASITAMDAS